MVILKPLGVGSGLLFLVVLNPLGVGYLGVSLGILCVSFTLLDLCASSLRRGHANLFCIVPILTDDPRRGSNLIVTGQEHRGMLILWKCVDLKRNNKKVQLGTCPCRLHEGRGGRLILWIFLSPRRKNTKVQLGTCPCRLRENWVQECLEH